MNKLEFGVPADARDRRRPADRLAQLQVGDTAGAGRHRRDLTFDLEIGAHGFTNTGAFTDVEYNGTFVNARLLLPIIGYQTARRAHLGPRAQEVRAARRPSGCSTATTRPAWP